MTRYLLERFPGVLEKLRRHGVYRIYDKDLQLSFELRLEGNLVKTQILGDLK